MDWKIEKCAGLTPRMASRLKLAILDPASVGLSGRRVRAIGLCKDISSVKNSYVPKFLTQLDLSDYDDDWNDWETAELKALGERMALGFLKEDIQALFSVPSRVLGALDAPHATQSDAPMMEKLDAGFTEKDILEDSLREVANLRWNEYVEMFDLTLPVNRQIVRRLVVLEIQQRQVERDLMQVDLEEKERNSLESRYQTLGRQYNDAAESMAALEIQKEERHQLSTLSLLAERANDIRLEWQRQKVQLHQRLEESTLLLEMAQLHKVATRRTDEAEKVRTGDVDARTTGLDRLSLAERVIGDKSEDGIPFISGN
jgi:hypothetical protein